MSTNPNDAAFAAPASPERFAGNSQDGLTKREHFAGQIMAGYAANPKEEAFGISPETRAKWAVTDADALIAALNANPSPDTSYADSI